MVDFSGVKAALLLHNKILTIQRDNKPGLQYAGLWDLPGGGREDHETPFACVAREVQEELGIALAENKVLWQRSYPALKNPKQMSYFMVITVTEHDINTVFFGDEGLGWKLLDIHEFLSNDDVVAPLKQRLLDYVETVYSTVS